MSHEEFYGLIAKQILETFFTNVTTDGKKPDSYWKLRIAEMIVSPRCNIPLKNGIDIFVYDQLLPGMSTWEEYYIFIIQLKHEYEV